MPAPASSTMEADAALRTVQSALHQIDADLAFVATQLREEFSRLYPMRDRASPSSAHLNPLHLLERLRALQTTLPALRESLLRVHHRKTTLATLMRNNLAALHAHAHDLLPIAAPNLAAASAAAAPPTPARTALHQQLSAALEDSNHTLRECLSAFLRVHANLTHVFPTAFPEVVTEDLNLALLRAGVASDLRRPLQTVDDNVAPEHAAADRAAGDAKPEKERPAQTAKERPGAKSLRPGVKAKAKQRPPSSEAESAIATPEASSEFTPVDKAVYNRLPRNLKIKAGKLPEINAFYEKVWRVLHEAGGTMAEDKVLKGVGESTSARLEVLRGLAVIRHGRDGWSLAGEGGKTTRVRERR